VRDYDLPLIRAAVEGLFATEKLDAIVYPTATQARIALRARAVPASPTASATNIANLTGFPDLIVPAGFTGDNLPVRISFFCHQAFLGDTVDTVDTVSMCLPRTACDPKTRQCQLTTGAATIATPSEATIRNTKTRSRFSGVRLRFTGGRPAMARARPEQDIQRTLCRHLTVRPAPGMFWFAVPNGADPWEHISQGAVIRLRLRVCRHLPIRHLLRSPGNLSLLAPLNLSSESLKN
jgi:hypothetical protein